MEEITREIINAIDYMITSSFEIAYYVLVGLGGLCMASTIIGIIVLLRDSKRRNSNE